MNEKRQKCSILHDFILTAHVYFVFFLLTISNMSIFKVWFVFVLVLVNEPLGITSHPIASHLTSWSGNIPNFKEKLFFALQDVTSRLCVDCFARHTMAMLNCLSENNVKERVMIIRNGCPAAFKFYMRYTDLPFQ